MAAEAALPKFNWGIVFNVVVAVVLIVIAYMLYQKFSAPAKPAGALTEAEYNQLTAEQKSLYKKDEASGYYVKL